MSFSAPLALSLAGLALPLIALYLLKVRLRRVPVSTSMFWTRLHEEKPPRALWQKLRHLVSLLIHLGWLLLLVLAVADPGFSWQTAQARRIILVLDNSASMNAREGSATRLDAARAAASDHIRSLRDGDDAAVILAGAVPEVRMGLSNHPPSLLQAIASVEAADHSAGPEAAIALARRLAGNHPRAEVVVLTDGCFPESHLQAVDTSASLRSDSTGRHNDAADGAVNAPESTPAPTLPVQTTKECPVHLHIIGTSQDNIGITRFETRRSLADPLGYEVLVEIVNASPTAVACQFELNLNGSPVDVIPLTLNGDETWSRTLSATSQDGGVLNGELRLIVAKDPEQPGTRTSGQNASAASGESPLGLAADDIAWAMLPTREPQPVLLITPGHLFLEKVLEANPLVRLSVKRELPAVWPDSGTVILHKLTPPIIPDGNVVVIDPAASSDLWEQTGVIENPLVADQEAGSPLMNWVRLDNVVIPQAARLRFKGPMRPLVSTIDGAAVYAELPRSSGHCLVLSVDLDQSDLAFRTAFPILIGNALNQLSGSPDSDDEPSTWKTGEIRRLRLAALSEESQAVLVPPETTDGEISSAVELSPIPLNGLRPDESGTWTCVTGPLNRVGLWSVMVANSATVKETRGVPHPPSDRPSKTNIRHSSTTVQSLAVNLSSPRESDLRPLPGLNNSTETSLPAASWLARPLWTWLVLLACVLACAEWLLHQRRVLA